jgi:anthranilate 1,2-dioxygenase small subunit
VTLDRHQLYDLVAEYGALLDAGRYDDWLRLFADECRYQVMPRENADAGLPAALIFCDTRAVLEDRIRALQEANKYNIHTDRHLIGLPRIVAARAGGTEIEAPFTVFQTDQEGASRVFATGLYRDSLVPVGSVLRIRDKVVLLDTFAVPSLLATPL